MSVLKDQSRYGPHESTILYEVLYVVQQLPQAVILVYMFVKKIDQLLAQYALNSICFCFNEEKTALE
jgi:hypothetical protein